MSGPMYGIAGLGDCYGSPAMISHRVRRILRDDWANPMPRRDRLVIYRDLAHMLTVAADKWEAYCDQLDAEEADR